MITYSFDKYHYDSAHQNISTTQGPLKTVTFHIPPPPSPPAVKSDPNNPALPDIPGISDSGGDDSEKREEGMSRASRVNRVIMRMIQRRDDDVITLITLIP